MENNKSFETLVESENIVDYLEIQKFQNKIKKANLTQLNEEAKNITNRKALLRAKENKDQISKNNAMQKLDASTNELNKEKTALNGKLEIENIKASMVNEKACAKVQTSL